MRLLNHPRFHFSDTYAAPHLSPSPEGGIYATNLVPHVDPTLLWDTRQGWEVGPAEFTATAFWVREKAHWVVCTGVGSGFGSLRFRPVATFDEARLRLVKWYWRRFREIELDCDLDPAREGVDIGEGI